MKIDQIDSWLDHPDPDETLFRMSELPGCYQQLEQVAGIILDARGQSLIPENSCGLVICDSENELSFFKLTGQSVTVGRDARCSVVVDDRYLSKEHFCIAFVSPYYVLRNVHSKNGVKINGANEEFRVLVDGDCIRAGQSAFIFVANPGDVYSE